MYNTYTTRFQRCIDFIFMIIYSLIIMCCYYIFVFIKINKAKKKMLKNLYNLFSEKNREKTKENYD